MIVRSINVHLFTIALNSVTFDGPNDVPIRIDANTPDSGAQWIAGKVNMPDTAKYNSKEVLPAAFVAGKPLQADASFTLGGSFSGITGFSVNATSGSPYGNLYAATVSANGSVSATFQTVSTDNAVDLNDVTFKWGLLSFMTSSDGTVQYPQAIQTTTNRIYTLLVAPVAPSSVPWAKELEVATSLAKGDATPAAAMDDLTTGIYRSNWKQFANSTHFVKPTATNVYDPGTGDMAFATNGGSLGNEGVAANQTYDLTRFLSAVNGAHFVQECYDNADLLAIFADSLGINGAVPKWIAATATGVPVLKQTAFYFPAGQTQKAHSLFHFHQVVIFNGNVYDPSTEPTCGDATNIQCDPLWNVSPLTTYMDNVFPGQGNSYVTTDVSVSIGPKAPPPH